MIIYKVTNLKNGKIYIGKTKKTITERQKSHFQEIKRNRTISLFYSAIKKHGIASFIWEEIDSSASEEELNYLERYWIQWFRSNNKRFGYNLTTGGDGRCNPSQELRDIHSNYMKNLYASGKLTNPNKGKRFSEDWKNKLRLSHLNKKNPNQSQCKPIRCIETGEVIHSIWEAGKKFNVSRSALIKCLKNKNRTCCGFHWEHV
jgi:group I intron endonuclease